MEHPKTERLIEQMENGDVKVEDGSKLVKVPLDNVIVTLNYAVVEPVIAKNYAITIEQEVTNPKKATIERLQHRLHTVVSDYLFAITEINLLVVRFGNSKREIMVTMTEMGHVW